MSTYLFALVDGGGTAPPELGAARRLVERGHRVVVLAEDSMRSDVDATGAVFRRWERAPNRPDRSEANDPYRDWECRTPGQLFDRLMDTQFVGPAPGYAADTTAAIDEVAPDLVVCGFFAVGAMVAAEAAGVPYYATLPNIYMLPAEGMPPMGMGLRPARTAAGRARDAAIRAAVTRQWDRKDLPGLNTLRSEYGVTPLAHFWDQLDGARRVLVLTSADFDFPGTLPANVRYVGPVLDDPAWADTPWTAPPGDDPLVLVSLSTTFQNHAACLQRIVDALGTLPVRALVTTGPALDPGDMRANRNVVVVRSAPHAEVLREAALVVTHGGHGTVVKALAADVPLVVLHHGRDQADNAARVAVRGAGIGVKKGAKPAVIARAVQQVLADPSYVEGARRLGAAIRRDAGSGMLLDELEGDYFRSRRA